MAQNESWIDEQTWTCLEQVASKYLTSASLIVMTDGDARKRLSFNKTLYFSSAVLPHKHEQFDVILVHKTLENWRGTDLRGRVILVTQSLDMLPSLWQKFKLVDLVVILQKSSECELYIWFPYKPENCHGDPKLELVDIWRDGVFLNDSDLSVNRIPTFFSGCPLIVSSSSCPPFVFMGTGTRPVVSGAEVEILNHLAQALNFTIFHAPQDFFEYFSFVSNNGSYSGALGLLFSRQVDIAAACMFLHIDMAEFDILPSHLHDHLTWLLPGPQKRTLAYGFVTAFSSDIWAALGASFVALLSFAYFAFPYVTFGRSFSWTAAHLFSLPCPPLDKRAIVRFFSTTFEFSLMIVTSVYNSLILVNLFIAPILRFSTAADGAHFGLVAIIRTNEVSLVRNSEIWEKISHNYENITQSGLELQKAYDLVLLNKTAMILGFKLLDQTIIRMAHPNISYETSVSTPRDDFCVRYLAFILPSHHPLTHILSLNLLNIVEAGLPDHYVRKTLAELSRVQQKISQTDSQRKPLNLTQLLTVFSTFTFLLGLSTLTFVVEEFFEQARKSVRTLGIKLC